MPSTDIYLVGTENYYDNYDSSQWPEQYPASLMGNIADWCEVTWSDWVDQGLGYQSDWNPRGGQIPESTLSNSSLPQRRTDADNWLQNNWSYYDECDAVLVIDYKSLSDGRLGYAYIGTAGDSKYKTGIVNMEPFEGGTSNDFFHEVEYYGTSFHEVCHLYDAVHSDGGIYDDNETSLMVSIADDTNQCYEEGEKEVRTRNVHGCAHTAVRYHMDQNL